MGTRVTPGLVVNEALEIVEFLGATDRYVSLRPGKANLHLRAVLREELQEPVLAAINKSNQTARFEEPIETILIGTKSRRLKLEVRRESAEEGVRYRILLNEGDSSEPDLRSGTQPGHTLPEGTEIGRLQRELAATRDSLATTIAEQEERSRETEQAAATYSDLQTWLEDANAELKAALLASQESERRLGETEERFERFMQNLPGLAWIKDLKGRYVYANQAAEQAFKTPREKLYGKVDADLFPRETAEQFQENDRVALESAAGIQTIETLEQADGVHHSIVSKFPIRAPDGRVTSVGGVAIDITERRKAEEDLRVSEQELSEFFENASVAVHSVGPDGTILRVNRTELEMLGYSREEYVGHHIAEFHAERAVIDDILQRLVRGETLREYPARLRCKDGSIRDVLINSNVRFENGNFIHTRCFTRDVTELKRAQEAQAALAAIVESSDDAIVSKSLDGIIRSWNPAAERIFGYTAAEAIGRPILLILPPDRVAEEESILRRIRSGQRVDHFESVRVRKGGRMVNVSLTISPVKDALGRVVGASKISRDITAQKQAERAIRESEERFRTLADSSPALIWVNGLEGCEFVNRAYLDFLSVKREEVLGFGWAQFLHPEEREQAISTYKEAFSKHGHYVLQHRFRRADGQYRWMKSVGTPRFSANGEVEGYIGSTLDITDIKEAEDALREADRRKDEFLAMLGHELRNPLAAISTGITLLQSDPAPERRPWIEEMVGRQVGQLRRLVDDLLDVSRITRGKIELRKELIPLGKLLEGSAASVEDLMTQRQLQFSYVPPEQEIRIEADPARVEQMVVNLLTNAAKYTPEGGKVWLSAEQEGPDVVIRCRDTGVGLTPEMRNKIFEPFAQYSTPSDRSGQGLGMGLTLVRALAELHGGEVTAVSEGPGKGSEFVIHLPAARADVPQQPGALPRVAPPRRGRALRILVVDDNRDLADSLALFFRGAGHQVSVAHDGETAVPMALQERPEIVILDIGLPGIDGFGVAEQLRASEDLRDTMIVGMSGWNLREKARADGANFDAQLVKPVEHEQLMELLQMKGALAEGA